MVKSLFVLIRKTGAVTQSPREVDHRAVGGPVPRNGNRGSVSSQSSRPQSLSSASLSQEGNQSGVRANLGVRFEGN